jgi:hypothetical protein
MPLRKNLIRAAWMAILLGVTMEIIVLAVRGSATATLLRDTLSKVAWSAIVCFGVAVGATASAKLRSSSMGLAGFVSAPAAFAVARIVQKALSQASSSTSESLWSVALLALLKALEYGGFGLVTGWMSGGGMTRAMHYASAGALTGVYFGTLITSVVTAGSAARVLPLALNEILFPIGCAMVLFVSGLLARTD